MKLTIPFVKSLGAPRPYVPGNFFIRSFASATSCAQVVGGAVIPALANWSLRYQMARTPPNHGTAKLLPFTVSLARLPEMMSEPCDQALTSEVMFASAPCDAMPGVSVLPSSVMSGPPLPLVSALVQSVTRLPHAIQSTTTLVCLYCGNCLWNWLTTPFIQVTCDGTDAPIRHTTSLAGAAEVVDEPPLDPQPAAAPASAMAAPAAAAALVSFTDRSPFPACSRGRRPPGGPLPQAPFACFPPLGCWLTGVRLSRQPLAFVVPWLRRGTAYVGLRRN